MAGPGDKRSSRVALLLTLPEHDLSDFQITAPEGLPGKESLREHFFKCHESHSTVSGRGKSQHILPRQVNSHSYISTENVAVRLASVLHPGVEHEEVMHR